jgi:hypothetical protein
MKQFKSFCPTHACTTPLLDSFYREKVVVHWTNCEPRQTPVDVESHTKIKDTPNRGKLICTPNWTGPPSRVCRETDTTPY